MVKILFVCMGNICRSPTAEGVFQHKVNEADLASHIEIDSAGTIGYHVGHPPDARAQEAARKRGIDMSAQQARRVAQQDFDVFDYLIAMDQSNFDDLQSMCPKGLEHKIHMFLSFSGNKSVSEVPDPYYGSGNGFEIVLDLVEDAADGLIAHLQKTHAF